MNKFSKIWQARKLILEGVTNLVFKKEFVEMVAIYRQNICNKCKYNDGKCLVPGTGPCCGACGCSLKVKLRAMESVCGLASIDKEPLWTPVMSQKDADKHLGDIE